LGGFVCPGSGEDIRPDSDTGLPVASLSVNSGAFCPTWGAPVEGGSHRDIMKAENRKRPMIATLSNARLDATIFESVDRFALVSVDPAAPNARFKPTTTSAAAIANNSRLAHGKSRVTGKLTKKSG